MLSLFGMWFPLLLQVQPRNTPFPFPLELTGTSPWTAHWRFRSSAQWLAMDNLDDDVALGGRSSHPPLAHARD